MSGVCTRAGASASLPSYLNLKLVEHARDDLARTRNDARE